MIKISIGCDHAGYLHKKWLINKLKNDYKLTDRGTDSESSVDYADYIHPVAEDVENGNSKFGIILCGSGNGAAITANKHQKIRAALCWKKELSELARKHNDANIISIPARFVSKKLAFEMIKIFLETDFEGGRHQRRIDKIPVK